jgi:hypothetical protein
MYAIKKFERTYVPLAETILPSTPLVLELG